MKLAIVFVILSIDILPANSQCTATNCDTCDSSSPSNCTACSSGYYLSGTTCSQCQGSCQTCSGSGTNCTACKDTSNQSPPSCACSQNNKYLDNNGLCTSCINNCATCTSATQCSSCKAGPYYLSGSNCISCGACSGCTSVGSCINCPPGQYVSGNICAYCTGPCSNCLGSPTHCTACVDSANQQIPSCACHTAGTTMDDDYHCRVCHKGCATCSSFRDCLTCQDSDGYFLQGNLCPDCFGPCRTCTGTSANCLTCWDPTNQLPPPSCQCKDNYHYLAYSVCPLCVSPCLTCTSYYDCLSCVSNSYLLQGNRCPACTLPCATCSGTLTNCITCIDAPNQIAPTCNCTSTTRYLNPTSKYCDLCISPCLTCTTATHCLSCVSTAYHLVGTTCTLCTRPCITCLTSLTDCITCQDAPRQSPPSCGCTSNDRYFDSSTKNCVPCISPCATCSSATVCQSCVSTIYYLVGSNCILCTRPCITCSTSLTDCITCLDASNQTSPTCDCSSPTRYLNPSTKNCDLCISPCATCSSATACLSCDSNTHHLVGTNCVLCTRPCQTCLSSLTDCITCQYPALQAPPTCGCIQTTRYYNSATNTCDPCINPCLTCTSATDCLTCVNPKHAAVNNQCVCKEGYILSGTDCIECQYPCATCIDKIFQCTSCVSSFFYQNHQCLQCSPQCKSCIIRADYCLGCSDLNHIFLANDCFCRPGYYLGLQMTCIECESPCATCSFKNDYCTTCVNDAQILKDNECICSDGYYPNIDDCMLCPSNCSKCLSYDHCTECNVDYYLYNDLCDNYCLEPCQTCTIPNYCLSCIQGYYQENEGICLKCMDNCKQCQDSEICEFCNDGYLNSKFNCIQCNQNCLTCIEQIDNCQSCKLNEQLIENKCYCNSDIIKTSIDTCIQCEYPCLFCQNNQICDKCATIDKLYLNNDNQCICEEDYIWQENKCQKKCPQYCQLCQDGICQECQDNYELINNNQCNKIQQCGNGYLDDKEKCDDYNNISNDGCYQCQIEDGWNCNNDQPTLCTYYESPIMLLTYINQTQYIQYVQLEFSQQIKINTEQNLSDNIDVQVLGISQEIQQILILPIIEASKDLSNAKYQFSVQINQLLEDKPQFNVQINQEIVNEYDIPLTQTKKSIYLNIPKYLSQEQKQKAELAQSTNQNFIYGLGTISMISLFTGEAAVFQEILKLLQYQSYLKYINLDYPQNLEIFFKSTNIVSVSAIVKYTNLNYYLNKYSLKQGPLKTDGKFAFYQYDADLITNLACQFIQLISLVTVAFITKTLQRKFYHRKTIVEYIYWINSAKGNKSSKLMLTIQKTLYSIIQSVFNVAKQFSKQGLRNLFLINSQDLIFKALIYLHYMQFNTVRNYIQATLAVSIIGSYLLLIFYTISNNNLLFSVKREELIQIRYDIINLSRQTAFLGSLVFVQSHQILQTVLISFVNFSYFVTVKRKKVMLKQFNLIQQLIEVMILLFTLSSFLYFDDLSIYFTEEIKILIGWTQIGLLILSLLAEASKFVIAKSQSLIKYIKDKMKESQQKKKFDPMKQFYLIEM